MADGGGTENDDTPSPETFDDAVQYVAERDAISKKDVAMTRARKEFPGLFASYQRRGNVTKGFNDGPFIGKAIEHFKLAGIHDVHGTCLHLLHAANTSKCFPQYVIPTFLLPRLFPQAGEFFGGLSRV